MLQIAVDQMNGSSDGGAILLKAADRRYRLIQAGRILRDKWQAGKVDHSLRELLAQRVFSIACGYSRCQRLGPSVY